MSSISEKTLRSIAFLAAGLSALFARAADTYVNSIDLRMLPIEASSFMMGETHSTPASLGGPSYMPHGDWDERPAHRVTIFYTYFISQTPVTLENPYPQAMLFNKSSFLSVPANRGKRKKWEMQY